jgi:signal transduction histidine kinase
MTLGGRRCIVSANHDITDRKRAERERARAIESERQAREAFTHRLIAAQEAERRRIAGELHDSLGQNLLLVKNRAQLALQGDVVPAELRWQFESIHDLAAQALAEVRQISHDLRPYQLDQLGLTRALEGMIDGARRNTGFAFARRIDPIDDLFPGETATHVFRIVQECMNNVLKHARAASAQILIERDAHHVQLWIEDDGCGFATTVGAGQGETGFGLKNIAERARILGGTLQVDSAAGTGTRIEVLVPIAEERQ